MHLFGRIKLHVHHVCVSACMNVLYIVNSDRRCIIKFPPWKLCACVCISRGANRMFRCTHKIISFSFLEMVELTTDGDNRQPTKDFNHHHYVYISKAKTNTTKWDWKWHTVRIITNSVSELIFFFFRFFFVFKWKRTSTENGIAWCRMRWMENCVDSNNVNIQHTPCTLEIAMSESLYMLFFRPFARSIAICSATNSSRPLEKWNKYQVCNSHTELHFISFSKLFNTSNAFSRIVTFDWPPFNSISVRILFIRLLCSLFVRFTFNALQLYCTGNMHHRANVCRIIGKGELLLHNGDCRT